MKMNTRIKTAMAKISLRFGHKSFRRFAVFSLLISLCFSAPTMAGWETQWIDKFEGSGVNWNNWTAQVQANYNNEVQCYTDDDSSSKKNYDVSGGTLKIIARKQSIACPGLGRQHKSWTSGRLNSKDKGEFLYGRIESRIRFLDLKGGTWPAFWMLENRIFESPIARDNDFVNWPNPGAGEIDIWEWFSNNSNDYITNFFNTSGCGSEVRYSYPGGAPNVQQWHKYALEWDENSISFYMDDTRIVSHNISGCAQYKEPMFVLLNLAMGGNLGGYIDPTLSLATMEVDYVAHCTKTNTNQAAYCDESTAATTGAGNLTIFNNSERVDWPAWDSSDESSPVVVLDSDGDHGQTMEFSASDTSYLGFTNRAINGAVGGAPFNVSSMVDNGTLEFDLKMTTSPGDINWKLKVESANSASDMNLSSSIEAHMSPQLDQWQHYSFQLSDLQNAGLDLSAIDLVMIFPQWGAGDGAVYRIDNLAFVNNVGQVTPVITSIAVTQAMVNESYRYTFTATNGDSGTLTMTATELPDWLTFDTETGVLTKIQGAGEVGDYPITLNVSDGRDTLSQTFTITVSLGSNTPPSVISAAHITAQVGTQYSYTLLTNDLEGDAVTLSASRLPSWLSFNAATGVLQGTPNSDDSGDNTVILRVSDGADTISHIFTVAVAPGPQTEGAGSSDAGAGSMNIYLLLLLFSVMLSSGLPGRLRQKS